MSNCTSTRPLTTPRPAAWRLQSFQRTECWRGPAGLSTSQDSDQPDLSWSDDADTGWEWVFGPALEKVPSPTDVEPRSDNRSPSSPKPEVCS